MQVLITLCVQPERRSVQYSIELYSGKSPSKVRISKLMFLFYFHNKPKKSVGEFYISSFLFHWITKVLWGYSSAASQNQQGLCRGKDTMNTKPKPPALPPVEWRDARINIHS